MPASHIVALSGRAGAGKDSLADVWVRAHGFTRLAIADPLRRVAAAVWNALQPRWRTTADAWASQARKNAPFADPFAWLEDAPEVDVMGVPRDQVAPRHVLQWLGSDVMRAELGPDVWVNAAVAAAAAAPDGSRVVVTDCRMPNEAAVLRAAAARMGAAFLLVRVTDPAMPPLPPGAHASEALVAAVPCDVELVNDKRAGLAALEAAAEQLIRPWLGGQ
jgi:hypothetical protein